MRLLFLAAAFAATPAMAADKFDLLCAFGKTEIRYRVDIAGGEACEGACTRRWKLGAVTSGELTLLDTIVNSPSEVPQTIVINRQTGALRHWIGGPGRPLIEDAICEAAPFSGFPEAKF